MATKHLTFPPVSLQDAQTGKRLRLDHLAPGAALVPAPQPILGYSYHAGHLTVYVSGTTPLAMRSAQEDGYTHEEAWLVDELPQGIQEIDITDCRREFRLLKAA
jgi:hypothetical protein